MNFKLKWGMGIFVVTYVLIFLAMRLTNLTLLPVFGDEVLHIIWVRATLTGDVLIALREGLRPVYIWLVAVLIQFWPNPLLVTRIASSLSGLAGAAIGYQLTQVFYPERRFGLLALIFYLISPFALSYDRLGLVDTLLTAFMGAALVSSVYLWRQPTVVRAIILGCIFAVAALTKVNAVLYYIMPILLLIFWGKLSSWGKTAALLSIVYCVPILVWLPLISQKMYGVYLSQFTIVTPSQMSFFDRAGQNLKFATEWLIGYLTLPFAALLIFALLMIIIKREKPGLMLIILVISTALFFIVGFKGWYPRYLLPVIIPLSVIFAWSINYLVDLISALVKKLSHQELTSLSRLVFLGVILFVFSIPSLLFDYFIIAAPVSAPWPVIEKWQYIEGPYSGYGLPESAQLTKELAEKFGGVTLLASPYAFDSIGTSLYLPNSKKISVEILTDFNNDILKHINALAQKGPVLTVATFAADQDDTFIPIGKIKCYQVERLGSFFKPGGKVKVNVYQWVFPHSYCGF